MDAIKRIMHFSSFQPLEQGTACNIVTGAKMIDLEIKNGKSIEEARTKVYLTVLPDGLLNTDAQFIYADRVADLAVQFYQLISEWRPEVYNENAACNCSKCVAEREAGK